MNTLVLKFTQRITQNNWTDRSNWLGSNQTDERIDVDWLAKRSVLQVYSLAWMPHHQTIGTIVSPLHRVRAICLFVFVFSLFASLLQFVYELRSHKRTLICKRTVCAVHQSIDGLTMEHQPFQVNLLLCDRFAIVEHKFPHHFTVQKNEKNKQNYQLNKRSLSQTHEHLLLQSLVNIIIILQYYNIRALSM